MAQITTVMSSISAYQVSDILHKHDKSLSHCVFLMHFMLKTFQKRTIHDSRVFLLCTSVEKSPLAAVKNVILVQLAL